MRQENVEFQLRSSLLFVPMRQAALVQYNLSPEFHGVRRKERKKKKIKHPDEKSGSFSPEPSDLVGGL